MMTKYLETNYHDLSPWDFLSLQLIQLLIYATDDAAELAACDHDYNDDDKDDDKGDDNDDDNDDEKGDDNDQDFSVFFVQE